MVKSRWKKFLIITTISLVVLVPTGLYILNEMANKALESALPDLIESFVPEAEAYLEVNTEINAEAPLVVQEAPVIETPAAGTDTSSVSTVKPTSTQHEAAVTTQPSAGSTSSSPVEKPVIEAVKVNPAEVTLTDKASAYKLAASKLSASDINGLIQKSKGGFTQEEKEWARALFYGSFTHEEQSWILDLFNRYNN